MNPNVKSRVLERLKLPDPLAAALPPGITSRAQPRHRQARDWVVVTSRLETSQRRTALAKLAVPVFGGVCILAAIVAGPRPFIPNPTPGAPSPSPTPSAEAVLPVARPPELRQVDGSEFVRLTGHDAPRAPGEHPRVSFEDGSTLTALTSDTILETLAMTERDVTLRLASGAVDVTVAKGGVRKWTIEAGELSVEVVGTRFVVTRSLDRTSVSVAEGVVLVRSAKLEDGVKRLVAGTRVEVATAETTRRSAPPSFGALLSQADAARQAGDLRAAAVHLQQLVRTFPHDVRTGVAAFQLALVTQQLGASASQVVAAFETALAKARGQSLRQDCYWRLVLALEHAGDAPQARQRAEQSLRDFPNGRYAAELRRRVSPPSTPSSAVP